MVDNDTIRSRRPSPAGTGPVPFMRIDRWATGAVRAFVSERVGGCSREPFATLNLAFHVGDDPAAVAANRTTLCDAAGIQLRSWVLGRQVHGASVRVVSAADRGRGACRDTDALENTDALVTDAMGLTLVVLVADCVPVMLLDPERPAIGLAHAGWRGTARHVASRTALAMQRALGCRPTHIQAVIGPSIGPEDYLVGQEVATAFRRAYPDRWPEFVRPTGSGQSHLDLWRANALDLVSSGLRPANIQTMNVSTARATDRFFSHRAEGVTGRFAACLALY